MTLGKRIKVARARLKPKVTQKDLADALGISDKAVSAWERGKGGPEAERMPELRKRLRVTYSWLIEGVGPPPAPDDVDVRMEDLRSDFFHKKPGRVA